MFSFPFIPAIGANPIARSSDVTEGDSEFLLAGDHAPRRSRTLGARLVAGLLALLFTSLVHAKPSRGETEMLRVSLVSSEDQPEAFRIALAKTLERTLGTGVSVTSAEKNADGRLSLAALGSAHAAVFVHGPGPLAEGDAAELRRFLDAGKGSVVLAAAQERWDVVPGFLPEFLGAEPGGRFADGAPMSVINLFPHSIYTDVIRFETKQPMRLWQKLADDAQLIMEGTVGEDTTPLAWVRRRATGRICHVVPAESALFSDASYLQIVANAVLWSSGRANPHAQAIVQRTFMPESHPGSFAITFPNGPGVCFDPVRGGINFIWDGDFVDLRPRWLTKQGQPARIVGEIFYREKVWQPLRLEAPAHESEFRFRGYVLKAGGPEFHYQIDGRDIFETISANADGTGITRRFRVGAGAGPLWIRLEPQTDAEIALTGLVRDGEHATFASAAAGEFTIEIRRKSGATPL
jgi:hypothetical protein